ncbi:MAG: hypothetical protein AAGA34_05005 [Pseudomonadota bacterium]
MRGFLTFTAGLLMVFTPQLAQAQEDAQSSEGPAYPRDSVLGAADAFFEALASADKTALADVMIPEATIFVHNRMELGNPRVYIVPVADHLARWARGTRNVSEKMVYQRVYENGDLGIIEGPYSFSVEGEVTHCGVNILNIVKTDEGWKVGNTSFTMVPPDMCDIVGANWVGQ